MTSTDPDATSHPLRALLIRVVLLLATVIVLSVLVLEVVSRVADVALESQKKAKSFDAKAPKGLAKIAFAMIDPAAFKLEDARTIAHPYLGYVLKPGWHSAASDIQQASHNSLGFRGKETNWAKPPGVFRIVTLGGSSVYGQSESCDDAVWSARLENYLNERNPAKRIEVINGGCMGWTSFEMLINLELRMLDFQPDLVVIYEAVNDMRAALYTAGGRQKNDNTHWRATWPVDRPSSLERWLEHSRSYLIWRYYMTDYVKSRVDLGFYAMVNYAPGRADLYCLQGQEYPPGQVPETGFISYRRNLNNMISVAHENGAQVVITTQALMLWDMLGVSRECEHTQVESFERIQNIQREVARERKITLAETGKTIWEETERRYQQDGQHMFKNDVHPTDEGSDLIARTIADALLASGLLPLASQDPAGNK